ncbi:hypothetical protein ACW95P_00580 [Candidatus Mycoplasma pogonae]
MKKISAKNFFSSNYLASFFILILLFLLVVSFINQPYITMFHSYTFGALFGFISPVIYVALITVLFLNIFVKSPNWLITWYKRIIVLLLALFFVGVPSYFIYTNNHNYHIVDHQIWTDNFMQWWNIFNSENYLLPNVWQLGIIPLFIYTFFTWLLTIWTLLTFGIVVLICWILLYIVPRKWKSPFLTSMYWKIVFFKIKKFFRKKTTYNEFLDETFVIKNLSKKKREVIKSQIIAAQNQPESSYVSKEITVEKDIIETQNLSNAATSIPEVEEEILPFDDPFE